MDTVASVPEDGEKIIEIQLERLRTFKNHPFKVRMDQEMIRLSASVEKYGIINPLIVRPIPDGVYEIISGHRRKAAAEKFGYRKVPVIIRVMSDDEAVINMVDSNLQRQQITFSEKAFAYKMKNEVMKRTGGRRKSSQSDYPLKGKKTVEIIGEEFGDSAKQVQRYLKLTDLIPELLEKLDNGELSFNPAVELSYLTIEEQKEFIDAMEYIQREELLPSEKAFAYKMKMDAMKRQGIRTDLTSCQNGTKFRADAAMAEQIGESARSIQRYIRLTELIPDLLDYVDKKRLQFTVAVDISYIDKEIQTWLFEYIKENGTVKAVQVAALRTALEVGPMTQAKMISILVNSQPGRKQEQKITFSEKKLRNFFSDKYTAEDMESVILELLDQWKRGEITV